MVLPLQNNKYKLSFRTETPEWERSQEHCPRAAEVDAAYQGRE